MSEFLFNFIGFTLLGAVAVVLIMGIYTLFKGGSTSKKYSNKLMQLRVLLQSSDNKELVIIDLPFDIEPRIIALWVIDLSPGMLISPSRWLEWLIIRLELFVIDF